ncbi:MAG: hypothetical protein WBL05_00755 [Brooklawnia sp.]|uniref:hypothetical protein n=1 Tax=Brooklawnia sp. TaxID=2699740 RepID=UPI003C772915
MTDQQWPLVYPQGEQPSDSFADPAEAGGFAVLVEENRGSGEWRWTSEVKANATTRADAQRMAYNLATGYQPRHPAMPQSREVFRLNPDQYLVMVQGLTTTFHFRISVAERLQG